VTVEQQGNRPPRKVFTVTRSGRALFADLLQQNLATLDAPAFAGDIGLMFLNHLPLPEALNCLRQRLARLDALLAESATVPPHGGSLTLDLALDHVTTLRRADRDWLAATIKRLETQMAVAPIA
jgi:hypothetical protein